MTKIAHFQIINDMKRIICFIFAIGTSLLTVADTKSKKQDDFNLLSEKLTSYALQTDSISLIIKKYLDVGNQQKKTIEDLNKKIKDMETDKEQVLSIITAPSICNMLVEYPLMIRYDSLLISQTLNLIDKHNIDKIKENVTYYKIKIPLLKKYQIYSQDIYDIVSTILNTYVEFGNPYTMEQLENDLNLTSYYKNAYNKGINIPYLDNKIMELEILIKENRLTPGNLKILLSDLK